MKLHEDRYAFLTIINLIHDVSGIAAIFWKRIIMCRCCYGNWQKNNPSSRHILKAARRYIRHKKALGDFQKILI